MTHFPDSSTLACMVWALCVALTVRSFALTMLLAAAGSFAITAAMHIQ